MDQRLGVLAVQRLWEGAAILGVRSRVLSKEDSPKTENQRIGSQ
jgi:hypothetical protein